MAFLKNNVIEARSALIADIDALGYSAYYEDAPPKPIYPYVVLELVSSAPDGANTEIFVLYVNGWDSSPDTAALEDMMFKINNLIDKKIYLVPGSTLSIRPELDNKLAINDPDVELKRREYRYQVRTIQGRY